MIKHMARYHLTNDALNLPHASHIIYYQTHEAYLLVFAILHKSIVLNKHVENRR